MRGTWPFPVLYRVVQGASPERVVLQQAEGLLDAFLDAALPNWSSQGAEAITTNCGFLAIFQRELAAHVRVPVATSALIQVPWVQALLPPGQRVGRDHRLGRRSLTPRHLAAAGVPADTPIVGTEGGAEFFRVLIRGDSAEMDVALAQADILEAGTAAWWLPSRRWARSCWNAPTCRRTRHALRDTLGLPVFDIYSLITWFHAGLRPREFGVRRRLAGGAWR